VRLLGEQVSSIKRTALSISGTTRACHCERRAAGTGWAGWEARRAGPKFHFADTLLDVLHVIALSGSRPAQFD
jgi:hypothetical protein